MIPSACHSHRLRPLAAVALGLLAAGGLAACGSNKPSASTGTPASETAAKSVPLVVYSAQGYDSAETKAFQAATGIPVKLDDNSTGPLLTQIEASKNNPNWGLLWVDGDEAFASLDQQGLLLKGYEPNVSWNSLGTKVLPADKSYVPTGITLGGALVYNSSTVTSPPTSWSDLPQPQWKNAIGTNDPAQSGPTYPFIAGMMNYLGGVSQGEHYFEQLKANGLVIHSTNGPTLQALTGGQIKLALIQSSAGVGASIKTPSIKVSYLNPVTLLPSAIGIDAKAPKQEQLEAEKFAAFVLSGQGQAVMQSGDPGGDSLYYPVVNGVDPLSALPSLSGVKVQTLNPYQWGAKESSINQWFDSSIMQ